MEGTLFRFARAIILEQDFSEMAYSLIRCYDSSKHEEKGPASSFLTGTLHYDTPKK